MTLADVPVVDIEHSLEVVDDWLTNYVSTLNPQIGRTGPVCPFVAPSRRARSLETRVRLVGATPSVPLIAEIARCGADEFDAISWKSGNSSLRALVIVLPDLPDHALEMLDEAHAAVKTEFVRRGRMIGQFHARCTVKAARNPDFEVSHSPVPLLAIRSMAIHDVFFLNVRKDWFTAYSDKFGHYYRQPNGLDPVLVERYWQACERHEVEG